MSYYIRGAATVTALVLPLILLYKLLWSVRRSSCSNDETNNTNCSTSSRTTTQQQPDSTSSDVVTISLVLSSDHSVDSSSSSSPSLHPSAVFGTNNNTNRTGTTQHSDNSPSATTIADSSDSPVLLPSVEYDVFLSFRGPDTRYQITDILFRALVRLKIHTFKDDDELRTGEEIWPSLVNSIGHSKIYVPIFSKSYAHSRWCLKELAEIVENLKGDDKRRIILPIFYMVDPRDVRHQTGPFENAFREHAKQNFDPETIQKWKAALATVAELKGWHVKDNDLVTDSIWSHLRRSYYTVETGELVAIDGHVEEVVKRLSLESKDATMVGLHGIGGIGKTTLAKAVYNKILPRFDRCSFVGNIRQIQQQNDVDDVSKGRRIIADKVSRFKILIVLDDIDEKFRFDEILGNPRRFVSGSRFIVTSRNYKLLSTLSEHRCKLYEVQALSPTHSLQLFSKHAFKKNSPQPGYDILSNNIVSTTGGLPLTLEVVGSLLYLEEKSIWEAKLKQLRGVPEKDVIERLKISYDALEYEAKEIFLDIACLYIGEEKELPCYMWSDCKFDPTININLLIQRSMVKIGDDSRFQMHDQLRDMGREIVRRESIEYPWTRSRIWTEETAQELLHENKGTEQVKAIEVTLPGRERSLELTSECFVNLSRLRYFNASAQRIKLSGDFNNLLPNLKWLRMKFLEEDDDPLINLHMKNLVILDLGASNDWGGWTHLKTANKLKILNLSSCWKMSKLPELPQSGSLEVLDLSSFNTLNRSLVDNNIELDISKLRNLLVLRLDLACIKKIVGGTIGRVMKGLRELKVSSCKCENLGKVLADVGELQYLQILGAVASSIGELQYFPTTSLKELATSCPITNLSALLELEKLEFISCKFGFEIPPAASATTFDHDDNNKLVLRWWKISKLKSLRLEFASRMWCIANPDDCRLPSALTDLHIRSCTKLEWVPNLENLENLTELIFKRCPMPREIQGLHGLRSLQTLQISEVGNLRHLDDLININDPLQQHPLADLELYRCFALERLPIYSQLKELHTLIINECPLLIQIPSLCYLLSSSKKFKRLIIHDCPRLASLSLMAAGTQQLSDNDDDDDGNRDQATSSATTESSSLYILSISGCTSLLQEGSRLVEVPHLSNFPRLRTLSLQDMRIDLVVTLRGLECLEELVYLDLGNVQPLVERLPSLPKLGKLQKLKIRDMPNLREIEGIANLESLKSLKVRGCTSLGKLPYLGQLSQLREVDVRGCTNLTAHLSDLISNLPGGVRIYH
ncbi:unnamed protein product [Linum tenue]|uniref:TIR domain-containing protein n=1 Tax=Linum tenue TaxID=586396 RepID=A0AAV0L4E0_9ROSI|nr:unnamed protein product [Linum tenue]